MTQYVQVAFLSLLHLMHHYPYVQKSLPCPTLTIDQYSITPTTLARNIGFDNCDQMSEHIINVCRASPFYLENTDSIYVVKLHQKDRLP